MKILQRAYATWGCGGIWRRAPSNATGSGSSSSCTSAASQCQLAALLSNDFATIAAAGPAAASGKES